MPRHAGAMPLRSDLPTGSDAVSRDAVFLGRMRSWRPVGGAAWPASSVPSAGVGGVAILHGGRAVPSPTRP